MAALEAEEDAGLAGSTSTLSLPFARRDADRLRLVLAAQSRLREVHSSPRVKHMLAGRAYLEEALRWMEIHGGVQGRELSAHWRTLGAAEERMAADGEQEPAPEPEAAPRRRRRRRRRRGPPSGSSPVEP